MKNQINFLSFLVGIFLLFACGEDQTCIKADGPIIQKDYMIPAVSSVVFHSAADIYLRQGDEPSLQIEGRYNVLETIDVDVLGNDELVIGQDACFRGNHQVNMYLTLPSLSSVELAGAGDIIGQGIFESRVFKLKLSGAGNVFLKIEAEVAEIEATGAGNIELSGMAESQYFTLRGAGNINSYDLAGTAGEVSITGSGNVKMNVSDYLEVRITGSGNVFYIGSPTLETSVTGSGNVVQQ